MIMMFTTVQAYSSATGRSQAAGGLLWRQIFQRRHVKLWWHEFPSYIQPACLIPHPLSAYGLKTGQAPEHTAARLVVVVTVRYIE